MGIIHWLGIKPPKPLSCTSQRKFLSYFPRKKTGRKFKKRATLLRAKATAGIIDVSMISEEITICR
jgi:hypothetical protein